MSEKTVLCLEASDFEALCRHCNLVAVPCRSPSDLSIWMELKQVPERQIVPQDAAGPSAAQPNLSAPCSRLPGMPPANPRRPSPFSTGQTAVTLTRTLQSPPASPPACVLAPSPICSQTARISFKLCNSKSVPSLPGPNPQWPERPCTALPLGTGGLTFQQPQ